MSNLSHVGSIPLEGSQLGENKIMDIERKSMIDVRNVGSLVISIPLENSTRLFNYVDGSGSLTLILYSFQTNHIETLQHLPGK